jgi:methylglyoxal synthase
MNVEKNIPFIASDNRKTELIEWSYFNKDLLRAHKIMATGNAGNILEGTLNKPVCKLSGGAIGYHELNLKITEGKVDILIIFDDELSDNLQNNSMHALMEIALANNIVVAKNQPTSDFILNSALMDKNYSIGEEDSAQLKIA